MLCKLIFYAPTCNNITTQKIKAQRIWKPGEYGEWHSVLSAQYNNINNKSLQFHFIAYSRAQMCAFFLPLHFYPRFREIPSCVFFSDWMKNSAPYYKFFKIINANVSFKLKITGYISLLKWACDEWFMSSVNTQRTRGKRGLFKNDILQ